MNTPPPPGPGERPKRKPDWFRILVILGSAALLIYVLLALGRANAATVEVEWAWPTARTDGAALPIVEVRELVLEHGPCNASQNGLTTVDGALNVAPPATIVQFERAAGAACAQAYVVDTDGLQSARVVVPFTVVAEPPGSPPGPPTIVRVALVFPTEPPPPVGYGVVGRTISTGTLARNRVYDIRSYGPQWVGELSAGKPCDCSDERTETWGAGTGRYCRVDGQINETRTTYLGLGSPFRAGSWTRCDPVEAP